MGSIRLTLPEWIVAGGFLLILPGCQDETTRPGAPLCAVTPSSIDFGTVLGPSGNQTTVRAIRSVRVSNPGTADFSGEVVIHVTSVLPNPPVFALSPAGTSPFLGVVPGGSVDVEISATATDLTSEGEHRGTVSFGSPCRTISFSLEFTLIE